MKIVLTGGGGFLGRAVADRLAEAGHTVVLPMRQPPPSLPAGSAVVAIASIDAMTAADWRPILPGADAVIHAAAIAHIGPDVPAERYMAVNRDASAVLAAAAAAEGVARFVFLSSIRAQVGASSRVVQDERTRPQPTEAYGESKLQAERLISAVFPAATHLRPPLIVGDEPKGNLALLVRLARSGLPLPFAGFRAPQAVIGRGNLIDAVLMAVEGDALAGGSYVIAEEPHPSIADMLRWLRQGMNRSERLLAAPELLLRLPAQMLGKGEAFSRLVDGLRVDSARIRAAGWTPRQAVADVFRDLGRRERVRSASGG
jgi:nucleoside-diphosphate-sugar epimerase